MVTIEQLAEAALNQESLLLRGLTQDLLREQPGLSDYPKPRTNDPRILCRRRFAGGIVGVAFAATTADLDARGRRVAGADLSTQGSGEHEASARLVRDRSAGAITEAWILCAAEFP